MKRMALMAALVAALAGCGNQDGDTESAAVIPSESVSETATPSPEVASESAEPEKFDEVTLVSDEVVCELLFGVKAPPAIQSLVDLWGNDSPSVAQVRGLTEDAELVESIGGRAREPLATHLRDFAEIQREYVDVAYGDQDEMVNDRTDLQAAGLSITDICVG